MTWMSLLNIFSTNLLMGVTDIFPNRDFSRMLPPVGTEIFPGIVVMAQDISPPCTEFEPTFVAEDDQIPSRPAPR
jgi:hypothetical protein